MKATVLFHSREMAYKKPFGAVSAGEQIEIVFPVLKSMKAGKVVLVLRKNDVSVTKNLVKTESKNKEYDEFQLAFSIEETGVWYYRFEVVSGEKTYFCGKGDDGEAVMGDWLPEWQQTVYAQGYKTPNWLKSGIIYHIFVDRFAKSGNAVAPKYGVLKNWDEDITIVDPDGVYRANDFYGGNLQGIIEKLPYLKSLSVTALYLSPVFQSSSNHRYDTADYRQIDEMLGTEEDFKMLITKAKECGMGIILDGVFNHTGADSVYFNKFAHFPSLGAYQSKKSPYHAWYTFSKFPNDYACWWGVTVVPTVRRDAVGYQNLIAGEGGAIEKWTKMGVMGWRLDVVDELSTEFVQKICARIKSVDPNAVVIGEVWEDASTKVSYGETRSYLFGKELDGVMNYPFKESILQYLKSGNVAEFKKSVMAIIENYPKQALDVSMSLIGTHDTVRAINACGETYGNEFTKAEKRDFLMSKSQYDYAKKMLKIGAALQYLLPGVPSLYYGDEIGMQGFDDPINRRPFSVVWDTELFKHYQTLGKIRVSYANEMLEGTEITEKNGLLIVKRGKLSIAVNVTAHDVLLEKEVEDLLKNSKTNSVLKRSSVIWESL